MPQLLISVTSAKEAAIALQCGADIIDLKDPARGALGALPTALVGEVVTFAHAEAQPERKMVSATIGDLPMQPALLLEHVLALSATNVDIIKIGFFRTPDPELPVYQSCLDVLQAVCATGLKLVAVLFAEHDYPLSLLTAIRKAGFYGVMYDTVEKNGATFLDYMPLDKVKSIANKAQAQGIIFGIAGSLGLQHVTIAKSIGPDYIGFRGGVCSRNERTTELVPEKIRAIHQVLKCCENATLLD